MFKLFSLKPYELDWGNVTSDGYNEEKQEIVNVFNFDISSDDKIDRCIFFSVGKILWNDIHIPEYTKQKIVFDLRGQPLVFLEKAKKMKEAILGSIKKMKPSLNIVIEIII